MKLGLPKLTRAWAPEPGTTVWVMSSAFRDIIRIIGGDDHWPFFTVGRHATSGLFGDPGPNPIVGQEIAFPNYSGSVDELFVLDQFGAPDPVLSQLAVGLTWDDETIVDAASNDVHPFDTRGNLPTSMEQSLSLVRAAYRAGYPELALGLFKSGALGFRPLGGGATNQPITLTVDASLQDFYNATVQVQMHHATGIRVLVDDTILVTFQTGFDAGTVLLPPLGINGTPAVPAPTKGIGGTPAGDTAYFTHTSVIDLASRSVWPFAIGILRVNNAATSRFDLFDSARLVDARQTLSSLVNPTELGIPRSANSELSTPLNYWTSATHFVSGATESVSCNSYPTRVGTNVVWYQRASAPAGEVPAFTTRFAVALRPASATAFEIAETYTGITWLDYNTGLSSKTINSTTPISLHGLDARLYATYQAGLADPPVNPDNEGTITPHGAGGFSYALNGTDTVRFGSTLAGRLAVTSVSTNAGGNDTTTKLFVDGVQVHSAVAPDPEAGGSMAQVNPVRIAQAGVTSAGINRPPFFVAEFGDFPSGNGVTRHYTWNAIPFSHGPQYELSLSSAYRVMTVLRDPLDPAHLVIYVPYLQGGPDDVDANFPKFAWSARLAELPGFSVVATDPPAQFDQLFGSSPGESPPPRIYSVQASGPTQAEFNSLDTEYASFLALPSGTPEELAAKIAAWDDLRVSAAAFFGDFHTVAWSENVPVDQKDTLVKILSGTGWPSFRFRGVVGLPSQVSAFGEAFP